MFKTRITEMFGIRYPIIQGGMHWLGQAELTAAVAEAGGLAFMTALTHGTPEKLRDEIKRTKDMTDQLFGINLTLARHVRRENMTEFIQVCIDEGITIMETAAYSPKEYLPMMKDGGIKVVHKCTSLKHALHAEKIGCDVVSIDGFECAGMPGEDDVTSLILIPVVSDALSIPVVASGGFGDGRSIVAALALGAEGINMGTRFVATQECSAHDNVKQALLNATEKDTQLIMRSLKSSERALRTPVTEKVLEIESRGNATFDDLKHYVLGSEGIKVTRDGEMDKGFFAAGQIIGLIKDVPTVQELFDRMIGDAEAIIEQRLQHIIKNV